MLEFTLGPGEKRTKADWGSLFWPRKPCRGLPKKYALRAQVSGMRFSNTGKGTGKAAWMGLIGASRLVCRIQRRITSIRKIRKNVLVTKGAMIYACRAPVLSI